MVVGHEEVLDQVDRLVVLLFPFQVEGHLFLALVVVLYNLDVQAEALYFAVVLLILVVDLFPCLQVDRHLSSVVHPYLLSKPCFESSLRSSLL